MERQGCIPYQPLFGRMSDYFYCFQDKKNRTKVGRGRSSEVHKRYISERVGRRRIATKRADSAGCISNSFVNDSRVSEIVLVQLYWPRYIVKLEIACHNVRS